MENIPADFHQTFQSSDIYSNLCSVSYVFYQSGYEKAQIKIDKLNKIIELKEKEHNDEISVLNTTIKEQKTKIDSLNERIEILQKEDEKKEQLIKLINEILEDSKLGNISHDYLQAIYKSKLNDIIDSSTEVVKDNSTTISEE